MEIRRSDVTKISGEHRSYLLEELKVTSKDLLAVGTEAEVYCYGESHVLKLYADPSRLVNLKTLKAFYDSLDDTPSGLKLPRIVTIKESGPLIAVIESKVPGQPLEVLLGKLDRSNQEQAEEIYLKAVRALAKIKIIYPPAKYMLFDESEESSTSNQTWPQFYKRLLVEKVHKTGELLPNNVADFRAKFECLVESIRTDNAVDISAIHGDFYPGNLLVSADLSRAEGVVDFGSFTLFGDNMLDVASAIGFYRMYDPERRAIRNALLDRAEAMLPSLDNYRLYRYLAAHAIVTCDLYISEPDPRSNGHFQWAVEILEDSRIWSSLR